jgi:hypothetical protein
MYSKMLYMKTRVTFRVADDLANALRELPNQTSFVESALREALRTKCPACGGTGRVAEHGLRISNFRGSTLPPLERAAALQLRGLVRLARRVAATNVVLEKEPDGRAITFTVARGDEVLTRGTLHDGRTTLSAS